MKIKLSVLASLACLVASPALAERPGCLVIRQIYNWDVVDSRTLIVENIAHDKFKVALIGPCPHIEYNLGAKFKSFSNSDLDCLRRGDQIVHNGAGLGNICPIKSVEPYTPAMQPSNHAAAAANANSH
jgi:Family of unknown function (DUF6491)